jgi:hypothetical protein
MLLGVFGLPGGAELIVIVGVVLVLFVPSLLFFGLGYMVGRKSGTPPVTGTHAGLPLPPDGAAAPEDARVSDGPAGDGTGPGDTPDA